MGGLSHVCVFFVLLGERSVLSVVVDGWGLRDGVGCSVLALWGKESTFVSLRGL